MKILVTHVTRMAPGFCCVAGITEGEHAHVRPVRGNRLPTSLLRPAGGPFDMGAVVDLGRAEPVGRAPELEDHLFWPDQVQRVGYVGSVRLWDLLGQTAVSSLVEIFGNQLERSGERNSRASIAAGQGSASLGCYRPAGLVKLTLRDRDDRAGLRVELIDEGLDLSLTDARFYSDDYSRPDLERYERARASIETGDEVILGVGLTRPFAPEPDQPPQHWLQVNAIHLESNVGLRLR